MVLRTALGAVVGTVVGGGFVVTLDAWGWYCSPGWGRTGCGVGLPATYGLVFGFWTAVAAVLVLAGFRALRARRGWWTAGIGAALWIVLVVGAVVVETRYLDLYQAEGREFMVTAYVLAACVAYAVAALCGPRASAPGGTSLASS
ncbi:hypothetical protein [Lentzea sp.]|uniref:hypothetical protein n=1 Tax=Lentzea sp. TaxID=56099 RepID=UPI002ED2EC47